MSLPVTISFNDPAPDDCPINVVDLIALLNTLIHGSVEADFTPYVTGAATPPPADQGKIWHKLDANGRPLGTFKYYNGVWRKEYDHRKTEIVAYSGNPGVDFAQPGSLGTIGGEWDGFQLCNGGNGSPNLSDRFIVGAKMDDLAVGYQTFWRTTVEGFEQGVGTGATEIELTEDNVPRPARDQVLVGRWEADGNTPMANGNLYGDPNAFSFDLIPAEPAVPPITFPTVPPYYALAYAIFVGYDPYD